MMKILHVINSLAPGGNERYLLQLLERLDRSRFQQEICVPDRGKDPTDFLKVESEKLNIPVHILPIKGNYDRSLKRRLIELMKKGGYDIVHTHLLISQYYGRRAAIKAGISRIISSEQNTYSHKAYPPFSFIERRLAKRTERIIACSESVKEHLIEKVKIPPTKIRVVYNSVDTGVFRPLSNRQEVRKEIMSRFRIPEGKFLCGVIAHLKKQKGHNFLLQAVPDVLKSVPDFHLLIIGGGILHDELVMQAERLGIMKHVTFGGIHNDVVSILNALDIFVLPSLWEGFGIAVIEAMACGVPVIASYVGGLREIITDRENGLLISRSYPEGLASAIIRLAKEKDFREQIAKRGIETVREKFDVSVMIDKMEKIYQP